MQYSRTTMIIVNACARRLGSRAGPRTGKERGFLVRKRGGFSGRCQIGFRGRSLGQVPGGVSRGGPRFAAPPSDWGASHRPGGGVSHKILCGGRVRFSAGSRGESVFNVFLSSSRLLMWGVVGGVPGSKIIFLRTRDRNNSCFKFRLSGGGGACDRLREDVSYETQHT